MNNTNNALETLVQRDKQIKKANDKLKASINELDAELETTTNALSNHASNTNIHTSKEELVQLIVDHLESLDLGITKEVVSELPTENISDNTLYFVPNDKGSRDEYFYINDKWELVGSTETNFTDYYTKLETDTLLEDKANSVHSHVVSDITDFPTIPTKLSQLENDMGFGTGGGSGDTSDCVHKTGNETISGIKTFNDAIVQKKDGYISNDNIDNTITPSSNLFTHFFFSDKNNRVNAFIRYAQRTNGFNEINLFVRDKDFNNYGVSLNTNNEFIPVLNNTYSLGSSSLKWANIYGTNAYIDKVTCTRFTHSVNNGSVYITGGSEYEKGATLVLHGEESSDAGSFIINSRDKTRSSYLVGKPDGTLQWAGQNIALDGNLVHRTGNETIGGDKSFSKPIYRKADITTSTVEEVYRFTDTNATPCGSIYNSMHWYNNNVYNRHQAYNATSGKDMYFEVLSANDGSGVVNTGGSVTNNKNLTTVTSETGSSYVATMGWVNNPATSTNVVHRTGNEAISGVKSFNNLMYIYNNMSNKNSQMDLFTTPANTLYSHYMFVDKNNEVSAYMQYGQQNTGNDFIGLFIHDKSRNLHGIQVTTNNEVIPISNNSYSLGSSSAKWRDVYATTFNGNLKGNADTATYATTQATTDNSTRIATTAWVRTYVNSVTGSNTVGSSISAYWSNSSNVTATGQASGGGYYPECYSEYITKTPVVGTIYSGAQLYTVLNTYASATASMSNSIYVTNNKAQATFSNPINVSGKYLCTTANTVKFRAYTAKGSASAVGASSVVNNSSTKSIFIRIE